MLAAVKASLKVIPEANTPWPRAIQALWLCSAMDAALARLIRSEMAFDNGHSSQEEYALAIKRFY